MEDPPAQTTGLLERAAELAVLARALQAVGSGRGATVVLEGPAGIGKSRLLSAAVQSLGGDAEILWARGGESERDFPFGVARQLFERRVLRAEAAERARLLGGPAAPAGELLAGPAWGRSLPADSDALPAAVHGLYWLCANLSEPRPLVLVVDDLHWCDAATVRFLLYLAHRSADLPILLLTARRTGEPSSVTPQIAALADQPGALTLVLAPLSAAGVTALVRHVFPEAEEAFCAACAEATGGNPFLLHELLLAARMEDLEPSAAGAARLAHLAPESVALSVLLRLSRFPEAAGALARAVAVLGEEAGLGEAAALARLEPQESVAAAGTLAAAAVLEADEPLRFTHPLVRAAVLGDVPPVARRRLRARAAQILEASGAAAERIAAQLLGAEPAGTPWAVSALGDAAASSLAAGSPQHAARLLERLLDEPLGKTERVRGLRALAEARRQFDPPAAVVACEAALGLVERPDERAALEYLHGEALFAAGRHLEAGEAYRRGLRLVEDPESELARRLAASLASIGLGEPRLGSEATAHLEKVGSIEGVLTPSERALLATAATRSAFRLEPAEHAVALALRALDDGRLVSEDGVSHPAWTLANAVLVWADELDAAIDVTTHAMDVARQRGTPTGFATASFSRSIPQIWAGRLHDAAADAEQALAGASDGWSMWLVPALGVLLWCRTELDDADGAADVAARLPVEIAAVHPQQGAYGRFALARWHAVHGRWARAAELLDPDDEHLRAANPGALPWRSAVAPVLARLGEVDRARALAREEVELAERWGAARPLGIALRGLAAVCPPNDALELLRRASAALEHSPALLERARTRAELGAALRRSGARTEARDLLAGALDLADRCGARRLAATAREELVLAGARPRRDRRGGPGALTPAELRVVRLAAEGATNREIAETLFVSRKTVDWHLRGAYRKLGVNDRALLAELLRREDDRADPGDGARSRRAEGGGDGRGERAA